tara:strand:- start:2302 stop:2763 length:462 start_codon:yes stop_codon:yes gene_type:complete
MQKITKFFISFMIISNFAPNALANYSIDDVAACAGVIVGNGAVDYMLEDEESFDNSAQFAYSAYLSLVLTNPQSQDEIAFADQILGGNVDKVIIAYNNDAFDYDLYEEIIGCYRMLSVVALENAETILEGSGRIQPIIDSQLDKLKRMLSAGL